MSCQIWCDEASDSVCRFRARLARRAVASSAFRRNNCASPDSSSVAERRRFEIVNPAASNALTQELAVGASVPTPTASRRWEAHSPFFLQCKGEGVNGRRRRESQAAGAGKSRPSVAVVACLLARAAAQVEVAEPPLRGFRRCDDFHHADALTVPRFGQARALARIWLEVKARELAGMACFSESTP